jgi:transcriptional regulator with XRE-family HTH domain
MAPDLTKELVTELRAWYEDQRDLSQKNLARKLYLTPQQLSEIFAGRNRPTGEQVLRIQEFLRTNNMRIDIDPRTKLRPTASNPEQPKSLGRAREMIEDLRAQLKGGAPLPAKPAAPASPTGKAKAGGSGADAPLTDRPNKTPMPASPPPPKLTLSPDLDSPAKIQKVLDQMNIDDLRLALNSERDKLRIRCLYLEIKRRENLMSVQN